jgi:polyisoprenoid-binding protein YceI
MLKTVALAFTLLASTNSPLVSPVSSVTGDSVKGETKAPATLSTWKIDQSHSELTFSIRHLVSRVRGNFTQWEGTILANPDDWSTASVEVTIQTASINTNNERRDAHLRTGDFFEAEKHPTITFKSTKIERNGDSITVHGNLTMRGVTKPVVLKGVHNGATKTKEGKLRVGFEASTTINRLDYGVKWNRAAEAGGMMLGDEVKIDLNIAAVQQ